MKKKILVLAPHTDDGELGCGGAISKFAEAGHEVYYAALSLCANKNLEREVKEAVAVLKVKELILYNYPVRMLNFRRQEILDEMVKLREKINPDIVFTPAECDVHQDHQVVTKEAIRAFKFSSIIGYEMPWNNFSFKTNFFIKLSEKNIEDKCAALACYLSQSHRSYCNSEFIKSLARVRGTQVNSRYAEAFEILRWIQ